MYGTVLGAALLGLLEWAADVRWRRRSRLARYSEVQQNEPKEEYRVQRQQWGRPRSHRKRIDDKRDHANSEAEARSYCRDIETRKAPPLLLSHAQRPSQASN